MQENFQLNGYLISLNNLLSKYIDLHNMYVKSSDSFWSIFKKTDYSSMSDQAYFLFGQLRDNKKAIDKLRVQIVDEKERVLGDALFRYAESLAETSHLLFMLLHALSEKAKGENLSMKDHSENTDRYFKSIEKYVSYGKELNDLLHITN